MATFDIPILPDPTENEALALFRAVEYKFPSKTLGSGKWYIPLFAAMVGGDQNEFAPLLYKHLIARPEYQASVERKALMRRIRETLLKLDKDYSFSREGWQCDEANRQRGFAWQDRLCKHNQGKIDQEFNSQKDFDWISKNISYGLYLSDHTILSEVETELTVLVGIMSQNLPRETGWHLRGTRRIGVSKEDVESIQQCVSLPTVIDYGEQC
ncbi:hypothetical protein P280DRAFT_538285 [Massarina eburnea CBS 473.64]|uniref:Uncharacterized protein n=1 Tax=Massarina eburnea CBS 473.64 TaxID=1395130 RepID=A0A6A6RHF1_9PLEO|nr:hypothetical protein P280DRAFT_538285 [Massarina eburnea CBS 473.64]